MPAFFVHASKRLNDLPVFYIIREVLGKCSDPPASLKEPEPSCKHCRPDTLLDLWCWKVDSDFQTTSDANVWLDLQKMSKEKHKWKPVSSDVRSTLKHTWVKVKILSRNITLVKVKFAQTNSRTISGNQCNLLSVWVDWLSDLIFSISPIIIYSEYFDSDSVCNLESD